MNRSDAFSLCELLVALGLAATLFVLAAEGIVLIRNLQVFNVAATRDLLRVRYFLEVECPEILREKQEITFSGGQSGFFFAMETAGIREISKEKFNSGDGVGATLIEVVCETQADDTRHKVLPVRLKFESPSHLERAMRRVYEVHGIVQLFYSGISVK